MRPVRLTMSAFGSYAKETTISFDHLEQGLFLITGNTGSGKTLIFDAIMYALYDDTSGMTRGRNKLRSDFATSDVETFVELEFILRGETYTIKRSPKYMRPKRRGSGMTERQAEVELIYPDGRVETMIRVVEEEVNELLGLDKNQFRQVAMIAQGEFYELIGASSSDRSEIFRRIFDTGLYERMQILFAEKLKEAKNRRERCTDRLFHELESIRLPDDEEDASNRHREILDSRSLWGVEGFPDELKRIAKEMEEAHRELGLKRTAAQERLRRADIALEKMRKENETISEYEKALDVSEQLKASEGAYLERKRRLDDDERGTRVVDPAWNAWQIAKKAVDSDREKVEKSAEALKKAITAKEEAVERLTKMKERETERQELPLEIDRLLAELKTLDSLAKVEAESERANAALRQLEVAHQRHLEQGVTLEKSINDISEKLDTFADAEGELRSAELFVREIEGDVAKVKMMGKMLSSLKGAIEKLFSDRESFAELHAAWDHADREARDASDLLFRERAGYLASTLKDGEPCPVCGSTEHPLKAALSEDAPDEATVERLSKEAEDNRKRLDRASSGLEKGMASAKSTLAHISSEAEGLRGKLERERGLLFDVEVTELSVEGGDELGAIDTEMGNLDAQVSRVRAFLSTQQTAAMQALQSANGRVEQRKALESELKTQRDSLKENAEILRVSQGNLQNKNLELTGLQGRMNEVKQRISGRAFDEVKEDHKNKSALLKELNKAFQGASDAERSASETFLAAETAYRSNKASLAQAKKTCADKEKDFYNKLEQASFVTENDYREKRLRDDERAAMRRKVDEEENARQVNKHDLERLSGEVKGLEKHDLEAETAAVDAMREKQTELDSDYTNETIRVRQFRERMVEIEKLFTDATVLMEEENMLDDLSRLASGRHSDADKITFEMFVQTWYFSQVIRRANQRYEIMTNGRYKLRRSETSGDQRSRTGLDLSVEDLWSANERPVSTLSGGEKFQAALALALGLSDVISEHAGGVQIDALFIDEGFGGLDDDSLQDAIRVLENLTVDTRLIGIISHVALLKQAITQQLSVSIVETEGSSVEWVML